MLVLLLSICRIVPVCWELFRATLRLRLRLVDHEVFLLFSRPRPDPCNYLLRITDDIKQPTATPTATSTTTTTIMCLLLLLAQLYVE